jgi:hypothetical protein
MPRFRVSSPTLAPDVFDELTELLSQELRQRTEEGPLIFEQEIGGTDTFHVIVVWQRWSEVPEELRDSIIRDAYTRAVTMDEAIEMNLLPFQITAPGTVSDPATAEQLNTAMKEEGGIYSGGRWQLRFPERGIAEAALLRLRKRVPSDLWGIEHHFDG